MMQLQEQLYTIPNMSDCIRDNGFFRKLAYLGEFVTRDDILRIHEHGKNTMINSPCGSGKSYFILNELLDPFEKVLILSDTTTLRDQYRRDISKLKYTDNEFDVMTYSEFGFRLTNICYHDFIDKNGYDFIICDEIHNLLDYYGFNNGNESLGKAIQALFEYRSFIKVLMLSATPSKLINIDKDKYITLMNDTYVIDLLDVENIPIKHYINKSERHITHTSQVKQELQCHRNMFKFAQEKCAIFCPSIKIMRDIESMCNELGLKPILIFSEHAQSKNKDNVLSDEAKLLKQNILESDKDHPSLDKVEFDVLIFNRAMETGINIFDTKFKLFISCTSEQTQQYQARSRFRMDMEFVTNKTQGNAIPKDTFISIEGRENKYLSSEDIKEWVDELNLKKGEKGKPMGTKDLVNILKSNYVVTNHRITRENKCIRAIKVKHKVIVDDKK